MNKRIGPVVKHVLNVTVNALHIFGAFAINTTAHYLAHYSLSTPSTKELHELPNNIGNVNPPSLPRYFLLIATARLDMKHYHTCSSHLQFPELRNRFQTCLVRVKSSLEQTFSPSKVNNKPKL